MTEQVLVSKEMLRQVLSVLADTDSGNAADIWDISDALRAVLEHPAPVQKPVTWAYQRDDGSWHDASATEHSAGMKPLYAAQQHKAVKLTKEQLLDIFAGEKPTLREVTLCRAIEAAILTANGLSNENT